MHVTFFSQGPRGYRWQCKWNCALGGRPLCTCDAECHLLLERGVNVCAPKPTPPPMPLSQTPEIIFRVSAKSKLRLTTKQIHGQPFVVQFRFIAYFSNHLNAVHGVIFHSHKNGTESRDYRMRNSMHCPFHRVQTVVGAKIQICFQAEANGIGLHLWAPLIVTLIRYALLGYISSWRH